MYCDAGIAVETEDLQAGISNEALERRLHRLVLVEPFIAMISCRQCVDIQSTNAHPWRLKRRQSVMESIQRISGHHPVALPHLRYVE